MRTLMTMALLAAMAGSVSAQDQEVRLKPDITPTVQLRPDPPVVQLKPGTASGGCWPMTSRDQVVVRMDEGPARTGTLLCMGPEEIVLTGSGTLALSRIREIEKPRDGVLDGVLKGAAVGLVIVVLCAGECEGEYLARATLGYAAIGGIIDSIQGNNKTIYRRESRAVGFKVRF